MLRPLDPGLHLISIEGSLPNGNGLPVNYTIFIEPEIQFKRGDANGDGQFNLPDIQFILSFLFLGGEDTRCRESADFNDDGGLNISDPLRGLNFLFLGGLPLPDPGPDNCGPDPDVTQGDVGCEEYICF